MPGAGTVGVAAAGATEAPPTADETAATLLAVLRFCVWPFVALRWRIAEHRFLAWEIIFI